MANTFAGSVRVVGAIVVVVMALVFPVHQGLRKAFRIVTQKAVTSGGETAFT